jgi:MoaA/NifB/PqqE/SkfB family radical SAM enzyme
MLADELFIDRLLDAGLDLLIVSLWAGTAPTYARLHPNKTEAAFHHLTSLLRYMADRKSALHQATPRVKAYHVICNLNHEEIPQMIEHGRAAGVDEVELAVLDPIPRRTDLFTLDEAQIARTLELVEALPAEGTPFVHRELFTRRLRNIDARKGVFDNGIVASIPCAAGWFYSRITTVGQVHACLKAHRVAAGDLREHDLRAIWFGEGMNTFRRHTLHLDYDDPWLRNIGHDINFALPGCFRICDNLGHNQHLMKMAGGLTGAESEMIEAMTAAAQHGATVREIEDIYRRRLPDAQPPVISPFSPPVTISREAGLVLTGDNEFVHEASGASASWDEVIAGLRACGPNDPIRIPVSMHNVARLDRLFTLISETTGRAVDPASVTVAPRPVADLHGRWTTQLLRAREAAARHNIIVNMSASDWSQALWRIAGAARPDNEAELLRALGALTGTAFLGPRTFHLDVTNRCEADCAYCWFHSPFSEVRTDPHRLTPATREIAMDWPMFEALADDLVRLETKEDVVLSGKGDPLSHPRLADMVRALKARGLSVTLFTGGWRLNDEILHACLDAELDLLYVSLSAASEATFARLHSRLSPSAFGQIVAAVRRLVDLRRAARREKPRLVLVDVLTARNDDEVVAFARLAADLGVDHLRYQLAAIETYNTELALPAERRVKLPAALREARRVAEAAGVSVVDNIEFQTGEHGDGADWTGDRYRELGCLAGYVFGRAWADGTLSFCCAPRPVGNLAERTFAEWWRSDEYDRLRLAARTIGRHANFPLADGTPLWTDVCRRCPNYEGIERLRHVLAELDLLRMLR